MKKIIIMLLFLIVGLVGCSNEVVFDYEAKVLTVGLEAAYTPFNWLETSESETNVKLEGSNGYVEGYDVQIAKLLALDLGYELVIKMIDWKGLVLSLQSGMIDIIIAGMSPTEDRKKEISFTDSYYTSVHVVVTKDTGKYANATTLNEFANAKVIGQKSTIYDDLAGVLAEINDGAKHLVPLESIPEVVNTLNTGIADVTIVEKPVAISIINNNPSLKLIEFEQGFEVADEDKLVSIGVRKNDTELLSLLNSALSRITEEQREQIMLNASLASN